MLLKLQVNVALRDLLYIFWWFELTGALSVGLNHTLTRNTSSTSKTKIN